MQIFSVQLGNKKFEVIGIADVVKRTTQFQALVNDVPVFQDEDYQFVRAFLMDAVQLNQPHKQPGTN